MRLRALLLICFISVALPLNAARAELRFAFGSEKPEQGWISVAPQEAFTAARGYGFEPGASIQTSTTARGAALVSEKPFYFSARVPAEGNYLVRVTLGNPAAASSTAIKAELRRFMVDETTTAAGQFKTVEFIVNTRTPNIAATEGITPGVVKLKSPRETTEEAWAWDDAITLEFDGAHPAVSKIEILPAQVSTLFIIGDSTVCDQSREPYASWGQMLTRFFKPTVAIANHAESGETYRASIDRRRLDKILSVMKPGDYLFMQFGHNDQKQIAASTGGPFTTYKQEIKKHVEGVRTRGGIPVIVSPMERNHFSDKGKIEPTLSDYAAAARQSARELNVAFIDLNAMSIAFYEALGPHRVYLAFAGTGTERDRTHHDNYGAYELAKCVIRGIQQNKLPLASEVVDGFEFDPARPDIVDTFSVPPSASFTNQRPLGD